MWTPLLPHPIKLAPAALTRSPFFLSPCLSIEWPGFPGTPVEVLSLLKGGQHALLRHSVRDSPRAPEARGRQRGVGVQAHRAQYRWGDVAVGVIVSVQLFLGCVCIALVVCTPTVFVFVFLNNSRVTSKLVHTGRLQGHDVI